MKKYKTEEQQIDQHVIGDYNVFSATGDVYFTSTAAPVSPESSIKKRELRDLADLVEEIWIDGVLRESLHNNVLYDFQIEFQSDAVVSAESSLEQILDFPNQNRRLSSSNKKILDIFDDVKHGLLILGEPGSGKTTMLLQLTQNLIQRFKADATLGEPIPVVLNLSTWIQGQAFIDWMIEQLIPLYNLPRRISRQWLEENRLLLMLDGLDEVKSEYQADCVTAINQAIKEYGFPGLVICSRTNEYTSLSLRLKLNGAIRLQPLAIRQVDSYLEKVGERLVVLRTIFQEDTSLQQLAQSPLMLDIMSLAYEKETVQKLYSPELDTTEKRRKHVFDLYVARMLQRKNRGNHLYTEEQTKIWLINLAIMMIRRNQTIFFIEQMQFDWLQTDSQRQTYFLGTILIWGLVWGLIGGVIFFTSLGLDIDFKYAFFYFLIGTGFFGAIGGLSCGLAAREDIAPIEVLTWSWKKAGIGMLNSIIEGFKDYFEIVTKWSPIMPMGIFTHDFKPPYKLARWLLYGSFWIILLPLLIIVGFPFILLIQSISGIMSGIVDFQKGSQQTPGYGIRQSRKNGLIMGFIGLVLGGLIFGGISWLIWPQLSFAILGGMLVGFFSGLFALVKYGGFAFMQHHLLRYCLSRNNLIPGNYVKFLDYAADKLILRKVGGGFIFTHRLLLEYFADLKNGNTTG